MRLRLIAIVAMIICAASAGQALAAKSVLIVINKSSQKMTVTVDGEETYKWLVSTGASGYSTPSGSYRPFRMERDHFSKEWDDAPMPFSIFFTQKGHAIHGSNDTKRLGTPASHGCVRLLPANAEKLFALVEKEGVLKTTVVLTGVTPSSAPAVARRNVLPRPGDADQDYVQPQQQYGQQQYAQPQYQQPQYVQPQYGRPWGNPNYYAQQQPQQYVQPQPQYQYAQPRYAEPVPAQGYRYRDPYGDIPPPPRPRTLFPF